MFLKDLQSAGNAGEFYTPRAVTDFMVKVIKPVIGERTADFACGTGGFLVSVINELEKQISSIKSNEFFYQSVHGIEKKSLPYILCITNLILHGIDIPDIEHDNALGEDYKDLRKKEKFDIILMNPPYGGNEKESIKQNFPSGFRSSETADLFMNVIMYRLKENGRCGVIIPDGFLFGNDNIKTNIKKKLFSEFNLHTVVRLPKSVFAPYTSTTKETWFYRVDMPEGYKNFSKTKPMKLEHFEEVLKWWDNREEIEVDDYPKAKKYTIEEIEERNFNIDLCGFPHEEEKILDPMELISIYKEKREKHNIEIDKLLEQITSILGGN